MHRRYLITQLLFSWSKSWWGHYTDCFSTLREDILPHLEIIHKLKKKKNCFTLPDPVLPVLGWSVGIFFLTPQIGYPLNLIVYSITCLKRPFQKRLLIIA